MAVFRTRITELFGIRHPILLGGMHHLGQSDIVAAVVNAGAMGFITGADPAAAGARVERELNALQLELL